MLIREFVTEAIFRHHGRFNFIDADFKLIETLINPIKTIVNRRTKRTDRFFEDLRTYRLNHAKIYPFH